MDRVSPIVRDADCLDETLVIAVAKTVPICFVRPPAHREVGATATLGELAAAYVDGGRVLETTAIRIGKVDLCERGRRSVQAWVSKRQ